MARRIENARMRRFFLSREQAREEFAEFKIYWREEAKACGGYVPARLLYTSSMVLKELVERGMVIYGCGTKGEGYAPA